MVDALKKQVKDLGCTKVLLDVRESNEAARRFYEKSGFSEDGVRPKFYSDPEEDAVLMSCII